MGQYYMYPEDGLFAARLIIKSSPVLSRHNR
jgi:hypothetical protein